MFIAMLVSVFVLAFLVPSAIIRVIGAIKNNSALDVTTDCLIVATAITVIVAYFTKYHIPELVAAATQAIR